MASTLARRPLPALISLVALLVLTALVWWRVLHRSDNSASGAEKPCPTPTSTAATTATLPAPGKVTVEVLNATNRTGIGARARTTLIADGFQIPKTAGNDTAKVPGIAEIRYGPAGKNAAKVLSYYLPGAKLVATQSGTATVVLSLGNRYSRLATPAAVQAAMAKDHVTVQTTTPTPSGTSKSC